MSNLLQLLGSISNPEQFVQNAMNSNPNIKNNPIIQNALNLYKAKDYNALQSLANNVCKEHGTSTEEIKKAFHL